MNKMRKGVYVYDALTMELIKEYESPGGPRSGPPVPLGLRRAQPGVALYLLKKI